MIIHESIFIFRESARMTYIRLSVITVPYTTKDGKDCMSTSHSSHCLHI